ncbi:MAG TPA: type II secretion system protein [Blastocatellia bacterium]|nr:type II secretion system protein [Blastocatellia bacterium]
MFTKVRVHERGFTMLEATIVLAVIGIIAGITLPRLNSAMREHRVNAAVRQIIDTIRRAKTQAVSENRDSAIAIDLAARRIGVVFFNDDDTVNRIEFMPLPEGVSFQRPAGITAAPPGVTGAGVVSFAREGDYFQQNFNSRGFPSLASGADVVSIFFGNGQSFRAVTMTSLGGIRAYSLEESAWVSTGQTR